MPRGSCARTKTDARSVIKSPSLLFEKSSLPGVLTVKRLLIFFNSSKSLFHWSCDRSFQLLSVSSV